MRVGNDERTVFLSGKDYQVGEPENVKVGNVDISIAYGSVFKTLPFTIRLPGFQIDSLSGFT